MADQTPEPFASGPASSYIPVVAELQREPEQERDQASGDHEPWTFTVRPGDQLTLEDAVYQALGAASACWDNLTGAGVFNSDRAKQIGETLLDFVRRARDAHAEGYAEAVARLRDDDRYRDWWTARPGAPGSYPVYWDGPGRSHLADYLETVGPDGLDVTTGIGVRSAGRALLKVLEFVALPFEANRAAYRLRHALGMSDVPDPVDGEETTAAAARRFAGELERLMAGLRERGIVPAPDCPVGTAAVDTALAAVDGLESTVRMLEGAVTPAVEQAAQLTWLPGELCPSEYVQCPEGDRRCVQDVTHVATSPLHFNRAGFAWSDDEARAAAVESQASEPAVAERLAATEPAAVIGVPPWLRGIIARHGEPAIDDTATSRAWLWDDHAVRITTTGSFGEVRAWTYDRRHAQLWLDRAPTAADVSAVIALAGLDDRWEIPPGAHGPVPPTAAPKLAPADRLAATEPTEAAPKLAQGVVVERPIDLDDRTPPGVRPGSHVAAAYAQASETNKLDAFDLAKAALLDRYGTLAPNRMQALGADSVEIGAAAQIIQQEAGRG